MTFVKKITAEGSELTGLDAGLEAIKKLDGRIYTNVIFEGENKYLLVGGGNEGKYICFIAVNIDEKFFNLIDPNNRGSGELEIVAGGQKGLYPENQCINLSMVLEAVDYFYQTGEPAPTLTWKTVK